MPRKKNGNGGPPPPHRPENPDFAYLGAKLDAMAEATAKGFGIMDHRMESMDHRMESMDHRMESMDHRMASMGVKLDALTDVTVKGLAAVQGEIARTNVRIDKLIENTGEHWRDHERRISALEKQDDP